MEEIYEFGAYKLSPSERGLWCREKKIEPSARYFDLLLYFVRNAGQLITSHMLREQVWETENVGDKTIKNTVADLRRMLANGDPDTDFIETVPTKGYQFVCPVAVPTKMEDVDRTQVGMKELSEVDKVIVGSISENNHKLIIEPGAGWEGLVFAVGNTAGIELGSESESTKSTGDLEMSIEKLSPGGRAEIFAGIARQASSGIKGSEQGHYLDMISGGYDRFSEALDHYGKTSASSEVEMASNLALFWEIRGSWAEGRERLRHALAHQGEAFCDSKAQALTWYGYMSFHLDDYTTASQSLSDGLTMSEEMGDDETIALGLLGQAGIAEAQGKYQLATKLLNESLAAGERGGAHLIRGWAYRMLGSVAQSQGDFASAKDHLEDSLKIREAIDDRRGMGNTYSRLSVVAISQRDLAQARLLFNKSREMAYGTPNKGSVALAEFHSGLIEETSGQYPAALAAFQRCFALRLQIGEKRGTAKAMEAVARVGWKMGQEKESAKILGAAAALRQSASAPMSPTEKKKYQDLITDLRGKYPKEYEEGSQRVLEEIIPVV